ncbi:hypothetical protein [Pseudomonas sp. RIT-PI-S]|uniref:hypothetical protein n=1 Tax=Pseudomonas sp. RIT-PI-S TaxID=3035295 RepID=UPI0021DAFD02|nr:hypothetical protein [Pseudomonas sp. RIT-PI-S]
MSDSFYEDMLGTLRVAALFAHRHHHPEKAPLPWLAAFIARLQAFGWVTLEHRQTQHLYTPAQSVWINVFSGQLPLAQPPNTRFKTLVRHVIDARSDGRRPLPRSAGDDNGSTHLLTELRIPDAGPPTLRLVQLAGAPDPQAPKTRLPVARTCWEATLHTGRFEEQRAQLMQELLDHEQAIEHL